MIETIRAFLVSAYLWLAEPVSTAAHTWAGPAIAIIGSYL